MYPSPPRLQIYHQIYLTLWLSGSSRRQAGRPTTCGTRGGRESLGGGRGREATRQGTRGRERWRAGEEAKRNDGRREKRTRRGLGGGLDKDAARTGCTMGKSKPTAPVQWASKRKPPLTRRNRPRAGQGRGVGSGDRRGRTSTATRNAVTGPPPLPLVCSERSRNSKNRDFNKNRALLPQ